MAGSRSMSAREPGQVRKEAAFSGHRQATRGRPTGACSRWTRSETVLDGGCTVRFPPSGATAATRIDRPVTASASLYRRHRPRTFADVVGQDHVVRTLRNAIEQDKVHHAYLFVGSRGTGKTSMAKILAASLNCVDGPTITPCGECDSCRGIASASSLDVIEMDAASNNSVDDIRDLREKVAYAPVSGHHKVYILDEAHMLTTAQAWNAFLKTLEEPPPNTIFVLATTEAAKVLPTVVDRCHRFDFARPSVPQISAVLRRVAEREQISIPDEASALIARSATGSFRDALGTLEQLLAYSGKTIALEDVLAVLGAADADLVFGAVDAIAAGDQREALLAAARLAESGRDLGRFFSDLEAHARGLMVVQTLGEVPAELRITPEQDERLAEQARRVGPATVVRLLELIAGALRAMKDGADARTQLELALLKAAAPAYDPTVKALLARIERLEARGPAAPAARRARRRRPRARRPRRPRRRAPRPPRAARPSPSPRRSRASRPSPPRPRCPAPPGARPRPPRAPRRPPRPSPPSSRRRPIRRPRSPPSRSSSPTRRRPSRASPPRSSCRRTRSRSSGPPCSTAWRRRRRCWPPCSRARAPPASTAASSRSRGPSRPPCSSARPRTRRARRRSRASSAP